MKLEAEVSAAATTLGRLEQERDARVNDLGKREADVERLRSQLSRSSHGLGEVERLLVAQRQSRTRVSPPTGTLPPSGLAAGRVLEERRDALARQVVDERAWLRHAEVEVVAARREAGLVRDRVAEQQQTLDELRARLSAARREFTAGPEVTRALTGSSGLAAAPSAFALWDIPAHTLPLYQLAAARCPGLSWTVLAAIGSIESSHGRSTAPGVRSGANAAGAMGPMQFLPSTWEAYGLDGSGDGVRDVYDPADAIFSAANYLCASGAGDLVRLADAIWAYNHADWYVEDVLARALRYRGGLATVPMDAAALVEHPNLILSAEARVDLVAGVVDSRVVALLAALTANHSIAVSVFKSGHAPHVAGTDRVSNHFHGRAMDIVAVDGDPVGPGNAAALDLAVAMLTEPDESRPEELGSPWDALGKFPGAFSDADHQGHLHVGWDSNGPPGS